MDINLSLIQGKKFKKYQNKISNNIENEHLNKSLFENNLKEGFVNILETSQQNMANVQQQNTSDTTSLNHLNNQFDDKLQKYVSLESKASGTMKDLLGRYGQNNPYNGNNVIIDNNGQLGYVTQKGDYKWYNSMSVVEQTAGKNGCPIYEKDNSQHININNPDVYNTFGSVLNSTPSLKVGSAMIGGQSCGNEGTNVYVDRLVPTNVKTTYKGCYGDDLGSPAMKYLGEAPPNLTVNLQNGNFDQPAINNDSYQYINNNDQVTGWNFYAVLINNSNAWGYPMPYPTGSQAACIQGPQVFGQWINFTAGTYNASFYACGRSYGGSNTINVYLVINTIASTPQTAPTIYTFTPEVSVWKQYSVEFTVNETGLYAFGFYGTISADKSTAIQGIQITPKGYSGTGSYTYDSCKEDAINNGYKYFGLQNMNPSTGYGYCAVSNDEIGSTKYGISKIAAETIPLWSSKTQGNTGCSAILNNQGSLSVVNSSGASIFATPVASKIPSSYIGCYGDNWNRAMPFVDGRGAQSYNYGSCEKNAQDGNYKYFGLQNSTSGENAQCVVSNDWNQMTKYGLANNCTTLSNGIVSGGGLSNAIYSVTPQVNFFLILQDDGNMCIYRGTGPNDIQGFIWCSGTNGKTKQANPNYAAKKGKYGQNWVPSGSTLAPGDFLGSEDGNMYLIMQPDGNLVLYTCKMVDNCSADQNNNMGGGQNATGLYMLDAVGNPSSMGKLGYVDSDANLKEYPASMIGKSNTYQKYSNYDSYGNDLANMPLTNTTLENCQTQCNSNEECNGLVYDTNNQLCYLKNNNMFPIGKKNISQGLDLYTRRPSINNNAMCPKEIINIDSIQYDNYIKGEPMDLDYQCDTSLLSDEEKLKLNNATNNLTSVSQKIENNKNNLRSSNININNRMDSGAKTMNKDFKSYYQVKQNINQLLEKRTNKTDKKNIQKINNFNNNDNILEPMLNMNDLNGMLNDSDLVVLQNNYQYIMWSILAVGLVTVTINTMKN